MSTLSSFLNEDRKTQINEGKFILSSDSVVTMNDEVYLRTGVTSNSTTYPLAANVAGVVGTTTYTDNLYYRVA